MPREPNSKELEQIRKIPLLGVKGKIFWTVVAKRLLSFLMVNTYVDTSEQKEELVVVGCKNHKTSMSQLIGEVKKLETDLAVV